MLDSKVLRENVTSAIEDSKKRHFFTTMEHLGAHYGVRKGCYSVYVGTPSCGKSGLMKSIAVQSAMGGSKVLVILSEEVKEKYAAAMFAYADATGTDLDNISFYEESHMDHEELKTHDQFLAALKEVIVSSFADMVIIDNITTSRLYGPGTAIWDQGKSVWFMKNLAKDLNIAIVAVAHTASTVSDNQGKLFTTEDHKGSKALGMEASYFYTMQKFTSGTETSVFLRTLKHREHADAGGTYLLKYERSMGVYVGDEKVEFERMREVFKARDTLDGKR